MVVGATLAASQYVSALPCGLRVCVCVRVCGGVCHVCVCVREWRNRTIMPQSTLRVTYVCAPVRHIHWLWGDAAGNTL
jgi:hypothetical protein